MGSVFYDAAAGSGKTTHLVREALAFEGSVLLTTFTDENANEIRRALIREAGGVPARIEVIPWFTFLLRHGVRPFQGSAGCGDIDFSGVVMPDGASAVMTRKQSLSHYACGSAGRMKVYTDKLSELALVCDLRSGGSVIGRIRAVYDMICVDEVQDMSGYDLEFLAAMIRGGCELRLAGDQRQATFHTSKGKMNGKYQEQGFGQYLRDKNLTVLCPIDEETLRGCHRCTQAMLDLADGLYPQLPRSVSLLPASTGSAGVLVVPESLAGKYFAEVRPVALRYQRSSALPQGVADASNFGAVKGRTFEHTLLVLTNDMQRWLVDPSVDLKPATRARFYVALTRARCSVALVVSDKRADKLRGRFDVWNG